MAIRFPSSGVPLRKFVDLFYWGTDAGCLSAITWSNFWDPTDPVADPLVPEVDWRPGSPPDEAGPPSLLYSATDPTTGERKDIAMTDYPTDNAAAHVGGGLPAHNYWDNGPGFVDRLVNILEQG